METSLQKIKKGTSHYISIADWPHKSHSFFYTQAGTATTMFDMSDTLHHLTCASGRQSSSYHKKAAF